MSLLSWFFPKAKRPATPVRAATIPAPLSAKPPSGGVGSAAAPVAAGVAAGAAAPAGAALVDERMQRREQLYTVVREVMVRVGVLSAGYKFKVLALDQRGAQFLVMVDMAPEYAVDPTRGTDTETMLMDMARARYDILVTAVYWRVNSQLGQPVVPRQASTSRPAPLAASSPAASPAQPPQRPAPSTTPKPPPGGFDPIEPDEVAAFKQALAAAAAARAAAAADGQAVASNGPLLPVNTGFEDTLMPDGQSRKADLSSTQWGGL